MAVKWIRFVCTDAVSVALCRRATNFTLRRLSAKDRIYSVSTGGVSDGEDGPGSRKRAVR
ncbi:MAG: hypothetical protein ACLUSP_07395 [Christensenellales bacterium]